jgi:hypothetical protein
VTVVTPVTTADGVIAGSNVLVGRKSGVGRGAKFRTDIHYRSAAQILAHRGAGVFGAQ